MLFPQLTPGILIKRDQRFVAGVQLATGKMTTAYVPTTGRLTGALRPGCRVWLEEVSSSGRKTPFNLVLSELEQGGYCSVNAALANKLFHEAVKAGHLAAFPFPSIATEVPFGRSRLDFRLSDGQSTCWAEVKSVTYVQEGIGMFPDAPTGRGQRHLTELAKLVKRGNRACVVFVAQREDALQFEPYEAIDLDFTITLRQVQQAGVEVHAYRCTVSLKGIQILEAIPVNL